ncbi:MAG: flagellar motor protein MotB [Lachnospiraceae bacterium]|nr:flagellar motor protein MotB [Lachnospiraceae bacterium]
MARKKKDDGGGGGAPAWMATFSDLMNLLLCFFVLLFSMSSVDAEKYELIVASLNSSFSILPAGGSAIIDAGDLVGMGISQLNKMDVMFTAMLNTGGESQQHQNNGQENPADQKSVEEQFEEKALSESEKMAEQVKKALEMAGIQDMVEVEFNAQYVLLTMNGALLFDSGSADVKAEAIPLIDKIGAILEEYDANIIEIEGHTDNVPISAGSRFGSNDVLSTFRALSVTTRLRDHFKLNPAHLKYSGRGEYVPVADNSTAEGRARNRRVEIKIYNSMSSAD